MGRGGCGSRGCGLRVEDQGLWVVGSRGNEGNPF